MTIHHTDPLNADSDNDGLSDDIEISIGTNPNENELPQIYPGRALQLNSLYHSGIKVPSLDHKIGTGDFTWALWVLPTVQHTDGDAVLGINNNMPGMYTKLPQRSPESSGNWGIVWNDQKYSAGVRLEENTWSHLAVVRRDGIVYFYTNGVQSWRTYVVDEPMENGPFFIGHNGIRAGRGTIDDVVVYATGLEPTNVVALMHHGPDGVRSLGEDVPVAYHSFDTSIGKDDSGNGFDAVLAGRRDSRGGLIGTVALSDGRGLAFSVREAAMEDERFGPVVAIDPGGEPLHYEILDGDAADWVRIDEKTGALIVDKAPLSLERAGPWALDVQVTDAVGGTDTATLSLDIVAFDSDRDGMTDAEEISVGRNPNVSRITANWSKGIASAWWFHEGRTY